MNTQNTQSTLSRWRNLGIIAHIDAGKTTLTERLLWKTGAIHRLGEVHDGAATTDYSPIERARGITIGAAAVQVQHAPALMPMHRLTLIDTPGHVDFAIEVERSLRVLDGAVAVFSAVDGVQPQSESVWRQAARHRVPLIAFVNKMDRLGADFNSVLAQMRAKLDANPWPLGLPLGSEQAFEGWVDLVHCNVLRWDAHGTASVTPWTAEHSAEYGAARAQLVLAVAEHDEVLAALYVASAEISAEALRAAIRRATLARLGVPVLAGSAFKNKGIESLLDAIVHYLPSPLDCSAITVQAEHAELTLRADPAGELAALLFKVAHQDGATLAYLRVYSGTLKVGASVWCSASDRARRVSRLVLVQADRLLDIKEAVAGEIVAVLGWKDARSGESISAPTAKLLMESIQVQPAVLSWRLHAENASELMRLAQGLASLAQEDPSFRLDSDPHTGETVVWGMGELHLEVMVQRLQSEWQVQARSSAPRVAYQETPRGAVHGVTGNMVKQNGGVGQFARVVLDLQPRADGAIHFVDHSKGGVVPKAFVSATEKGVRAALAQGPLGYPVVGVDVTLVDGEFHAQDSSDIAFQRAGIEAVKAALAQVETQLLEPIMQLQIDTPSAHLGDVIGDLQRRLGRIVTIEDRGARAEVVAQVPLAKLEGYSTALRSLSQGRADANTRFLQYEAQRG
jgi:elongation factor G